MCIIENLKDRVLAGGLIQRQEALQLYDQPLEPLCAAANELREHFCSNGFDLCTIVNAKSGRCSEDCKFCAQSAHNHTCAAQYPLLPPEEILRQAKHNETQGVLRYSIVTSGKRLSDPKVDLVCAAIRMIRAQCSIGVCVSLGLLSKEQYRRLREAGATRVHNNLETSRRNFANICTTHSYEDKLAAIRAAADAGLSVCSGGIMGLGETVEDRVEMALELRELGIQSVPINMLNPIPGTPLGQNRQLSTDEMRRIVAVYRFILPATSIRLAGGRGLMEDKGEGCFLAGANAAISGDMLTTAGITTETDLLLLKKLGYEAKRCNG